MFPWAPEGTAMPEQQRTSIFMTLPHGANRHSRSSLRTSDLSYSGKLAYASKVERLAVTNVAHIDKAQGRPHRLRRPRRRLHLANVRVPGKGRGKSLGMSSYWPATRAQLSQRGTSSKPCHGEVIARRDLGIKKISEPDLGTGRNNPLVISYIFPIVKT